jgi:hypothetical protein
MLHRDILISNCIDEQDASQSAAHSQDYNGMTEKEYAASI